MSTNRFPYEKLICKICGDGWRNLPESDLDGAWGVAIVRSILDGVAPNLRNIATHLGVDPEKLRHAFTLLNLNGVFFRDRIHNDHRALNAEDKWAWGYYAGLASGATGNVIGIKRYQNQS